MILISEKKNPSKAWKLIRDKDGDIITDGYIYSIYDIYNKIEEARDLAAKGLPVPPIRYYEAVQLENLEAIDTLPIYRGKMRFHSIYAGTSSIQIKFKSLTDKIYVMEGVSTDPFFLAVGEGKIKMDSDGYYEFNFGFVKRSNKVFMTLEDHDCHE